MLQINASFVVFCMCCHLRFLAMATFGLEWFERSFLYIFYVHWAPKVSSSNNFAIDGAIWVQFLVIWIKSRSRYVTINRIQVGLSILELFGEVLWPGTYVWSWLYIKLIDRTFFIGLASSISSYPVSSILQPQIFRSRRKFLPWICFDSTSFLSFF